MHPFFLLTNTLVGAYETWKEIVEMYKIVAEERENKKLEKKEPKVIEPELCDKAAVEATSGDSSNNSNNDNNVTESDSASSIGLKLQVDAPVFVPRKVI